MSKKFTPEELDKLTQELIESNIDLNSLGPFKKPRKSVKTPLEKLKTTTC